ncbi:MAG: hypothetical protein NT170_03565 [Candidatus Moranbacteria bacterium]|nr:hypothetical protein [Candidatus Moranbacteria bacterium]
MKRPSVKQKALNLRKQGKTYQEIARSLKVSLPKSTLSYWCRSIPLPNGYDRKVREYNLSNLGKARKVALQIQKKKRKDYLELLRGRNTHLARLIKDPNIAKIALAVLYLGEGRKNIKRSSLMFGNSDPNIVKFFLDLLRVCYNIDERKFRCTVQCRADQKIEELEKFWQNVTKVPPSQFYKARVDPRTVGKISKKPEYKGVCRIDYFSAELLIELLQIGEIIRIK